MNETRANWLYLARLAEQNERFDGNQKSIAVNLYFPLFRLRYGRIHGQSGKGRTK